VEFSMDDLITMLRIPARAGAPLAASQQRPGDLRFVRAAVGGPAESAELALPAATMCVNMDGAQVGLPVNRRATLLLRASTPSRRREQVFGDVVVLGPPRLGVDTSLPTQLSWVLLNDHAGYQVTLQRPDAQTGVRDTGHVWVSVWDAYRGGLAIARAMPSAAVVAVTT
jgi:hypothetical protein